MQVFTVLLDESFSFNVGTFLGHLVRVWEICQSFFSDQHGLNCAKLTIYENCVQKVASNFHSMKTNLEEYSSAVLPFSSSMHTPLVIFILARRLKNANLSQRMISCWCCMTEQSVYGDKVHSLYPA